MISRSILHLSIQDLEQLRSLFIIAASGLGLIGLPFLINILIRIQDVRVKVLEKRSPKAVMEEISESEKLRSLEVQILTAQLEERRGALAKLIASVELLNHSGFSQIDAQFSRLSFYIGSAKGHRLYQAIVTEMSQRKRRSTKGRLIADVKPSTTLLSGYEESLRRQMNLMRSFIDDGESK